MIEELKTCDPAMLAEICDDPYKPCPVGDKSKCPHFTNKRYAAFHTDAMPCMMNSFHVTASMWKKVFLMKKYGLNGEGND